MLKVYLLNLNFFRVPEETILGLALDQHLEALSLISLDGIIIFLAAEHTPGQSGRYNPNLIFKI